MFGLGPWPHGTGLDCHHLFNHLAPALQVFIFVSFVARRIVHVDIDLPKLAGFPGAGPNTEDVFTLS